MIRLEFSPKNNPEISDIKDKNDRSKNKIFYPTNINSAMNKKLNFYLKQNTNMPKKMSVSKLVKKVTQPLNVKDAKGNISVSCKKEMASLSENKSNNNFISISNNNIGSLNYSRLNRTISTGKASLHRSLKSPSGIIAYSSGNNFKVEVDFNTIAEKKFYREASDTGKKRLSTVSMKLSSPDRYNNKLNSQGSKNNLRKSNNSLSSKIIYNNNDKRPSECILSDILDKNSRINKIVDQNKEDNENIVYDRIVNLSFTGESYLEILFEAFDTFKCQIESSLEKMNMTEKLFIIFENLNEKRTNYKFLYF